MRILVLNGGSSSFKCALYDFTGTPAVTALPPVWKKTPEWKGASLDEVLDPVLREAGKIDAAGHRIVHGGAYRSTAWLDSTVRAAIASQAEIAPAHNRFELEAVAAVDRIFGAAVPQFAVFDTSFHSTLEPAAYVYPGPREWLLQEGIRRYGFHGISHQYTSRRAAEILGKTPQRLLACHLGSGASLCAVRDGKSVDTTMGFTPLEGLMMGTRCGSIDPGIIVYLIRHRGYTAEQLDHILNRESGLLGVSGNSGDMRTILRLIQEGDAQAKLAFDIYVHRLTREAGAMIAVMGGLDAIVFTGGVGENCGPVREALCERLSFLGAVPVLVIPAEEEWEIAREGWHLLRAP